MDMGWRAGEKELEAWVRTRRLQRRRTYGGRILHGHFVLVRGDTRDVGRAPKLVLGASFETMYVKRWVDVTMEYDVRCTMYDVRRGTDAPPLSLLTQRRAATQGGETA